MTIVVTCLYALGAAVFSAMAVFFGVAVSLNPQPDDMSGLIAVIWAVPAGALNFLVCVVAGPRLARSWLNERGAAHRRIVAEALAIPAALVVVETTAYYLVL